MSASQSYSCDFCDYSTQSKYLLKVHSTVQHGKRQTSETGRYGLYDGENAKLPLETASPKLESRSTVPGISSHSTANSSDNSSQRDLPKPPPADSQKVSAQLGFANKAANYKSQHAPDSPPPGLFPFDSLSHLPRPSREMEIPVPKPPSDTLPSAAHLFFSDDSVWKPVNRMIPLPIIEPLVVKANSASTPSATKRPKPMPYVLIPYSSSPPPPPPPRMEEFVIPMAPSQALPSVDELFASSNTEWLPVEKLTAPPEAKRSKMLVRSELPEKAGNTDTKVKEPETSTAIYRQTNRKRGQDDVGYEGPSAKRANVSISPLDSSSSSPSPPPPPPLSEFAIPMPPPQILPIVDELFSSSDTECVPAEKFTAAIEAKRPKMKAQQELQVKPDIAEKEAKEPVHAGERSGTQALPSHLRFYDIFQRKDRQNSLKRSQAGEGSDAGPSAKRGKR